MIRIEIGAMPPLLRSIVSSALETAGDMAVVAPAAAAEGTIAAQADVLIVCSDRERDNCIPLRQLAGTRSGAIVAIDSAGASATILRVTVERTPILGATGLRDAVRLAAHGSGVIN